MTGIYIDKYIHISTNIYIYIHVYTYICTYLRCGAALGSIGDINDDTVRQQHPSFKKV
jgi:hypothetical protein